MEWLKPCPFCGGKAQFRYQIMSDGCEYRAVVCSKCGVTMPGNFSIDGDQAEWDWNTRSPRRTYCICPKCGLKIVSEDDE